MDIDYKFYAKEIISILVSRVFDDSLSDKTITYLELAKLIKFPEPYTGNYFQGNIGRTLGEVCDLLINVNVPQDLKPVPIIQTLVVSKTSLLPSYGLKVIVPGYDKLPDNEKRTFVITEHEKIQRYGENWLQVLKALQIKIHEKHGASTKGKLYNPFGSEGSPEHRNVKQYIIKYHHLLGYKGHEAAFEEYPLLSGDKIDVVFRDNDTIYAYEAKSIRSNDEDLLRGIFQCVKYKKVIEAETKVGARNTQKVICALVTETNFEDKKYKKYKKFCEELGIKYYCVSVNEKNN
ncbi:MAG: hypothetical protein PUC37_00880 [Spirochaetales bacterium]|nr:hypothetical protein [Spirochaetales bacterium]